MIQWPAGLRVRPVSEWPGARTARPRRSAFSAQWRDTVALLRRELGALHARDVVLMVDIREDQLRLDGLPRANAIPASPGVVLAFETPDGPLMFPADQFDDWQDNTRAIALTLEALRKIDRYGVTTHGEQYRGWRAIEAAPARPDVFHDEVAAAAWLRAMLEVHGQPAPHGIEEDVLLRRAQRVAHPDHGGNREDWALVQEAERVFRDCGLL